MAFSNEQFRLDGKVAVVTGAGGRGNSIGRAYALGLANAGAAVVVADINGDGAQSVADEITALGCKAIAVRVDITNRESTAAMAASATEAFGGIDILVNNAALMVEIVGAPASQISTENFDRALRVNLHGALNCTQAVIASMAARGGGRIVNQLSAGAFPAQTVYGVTKLALLGLTTTLATELGSQNITVNAIAPGMTTSAAGLSLTPPDSPLVAYVQGRTPIHGMADPQELVGPLLLLVSEAGRWMTGQTLNVDGGWVMRS
ncbi:SDR family oxidoreductase [Blastomonas sp.]|uniref:SDR family oxidoreductase n=1 Tax=Blastomonas sp. TaxID=1909299 RepID=UPI00262B27DC|nr:SDR family oxidoreductase [Blastomonas sp.]MDM7956655.1 SDR family oxidoreductase [Blastomonas sp.]